MIHIYMMSAKIYGVIVISLRFYLMVLNFIENIYRNIVKADVVIYILVSLVIKEIYFTIENMINDFRGLE